ncbi:MAG: DUF2846 domain-containing protein [Gammaproteobacteria bacterium]|nr:DUF2846 domain-containing protein [Gammaproteobacteria bacterium]
MRALHLSVVILAGLLVACAGHNGVRFSGIVGEPDNAVVYVYAANTACIDLGQMTTDIRVDGETRFALAENTHARVVLAPGRYRFAAASDDQIACHGRLMPGRAWPAVELEAEAGKRYFLQYNPPSPRCLSTCERRLQVVGEATARDAMAGTFAVGGLR